LFIKSLTGQTITCDVEQLSSVLALKQNISAQCGVPSEEIVLVHGFATLEDEATLHNVTAESEISMTLRLLAGKKKRKKKIYTKPKKIAHKHVNRPKAFLTYINVSDAGKITKNRIECEKCPAGTYLADHEDRHHCGRCGLMFYKLTKDGKRLPPPKQRKRVKDLDEKKAAPAKGKKKGK
jgi:small subunit ribosomal protein S27Ae